MIKRLPTHCSDETCSSCVVARDYIFLAHHAGGFEKNDIAYQTRIAFEAIKNTLASVGTTLDDTLNLLLSYKHRG